MVLMAKKISGSESFTLSHRGLVREKNEDDIQVSTIKTADGVTAQLAVLADGVGGHNAGEIASRIAVETISMAMQKNVSASDPHQALEQAIQSANQAILSDAALHPQRKGMGTTCVCALIIDHTLFAVHLGDSRLYLYRDPSLFQLTKDHTVLAEMGNNFNTSVDLANRSHPMAHVLSRYLGTTHPLNIDQKITYDNTTRNSLHLRCGDTLLLCSDGITDMLDDTEIREILSACLGRKRAQTLVYHALEKGGHDNASVIVLDIP